MIITREDVLGKMKNSGFNVKVMPVFGAVGFYVEVNWQMVPICFIPFGRLSRAPQEIANKTGLIIIVTMHDLVSKNVVQL